MKPPDRKLLRLIALFKLAKAILLIAVGVSALKLIHQDVARVIEHWVAILGIDPGKQYVAKALQKAADLTPNKIRGLGIVSFFYAGLFLTEGTGLWLEKRWAEWFTTILTASLVPFEVYEIVRHFGPIKVVVLIANIAIVAYLIHRISTENADAPASRSSSKR
jgi:uncharacterized membrane protein (DUF2068 family)